MKQVTAGDVQGYIQKLSRLSADALKARIATIKKAQKAVERMIESGKFVPVGKKGPHTKAQAVFSQRGLANALKWCLEAQELQGKTATAAAQCATAIAPKPSNKSTADQLKELLEQTLPSKVKPKALALLKVLRDTAPKPAHVKAEVAVAEHEAPAGLVGLKRITNVTNGVKWELHKSDRGTSRESLRWEGSVSSGSDIASALLRVVENKAKDGAIELELLVRRPSDKQYTPVGSASVDGITETDVKVLLGKSSTKAKEEICCSK